MRVSDKGPGPMVSGTRSGPCAIFQVSASTASPAPSGTRSPRRRGERSRPTSKGGQVGHRHKGGIGIGGLGLGRRDDGRRRGCRSASRTVCRGRRQSCGSPLRAHRAPLDREEPERCPLRTSLRNRAPATRSSSTRMPLPNRAWASPTATRTPSGLRAICREVSCARGSADSPSLQSSEIPSATMVKRRAASPYGRRQQRSRQSCRRPSTNVLAEPLLCARKRAGHRARRGAPGGAFAPEVKLCLRRARLYARERPASGRRTSEKPCGKPSGPDGLQQKRRHAAWPPQRQPSPERSGRTSPPRADDSRTHRRRDVDGLSPDPRGGKTQARESRESQPHGPTAA